MALEQRVAAVLCIELPSSMSHRISPTVPALYNELSHDETTRRCVCLFVVDLALT